MAEWAKLLSDDECSWCEVTHKANSDYDVLITQDHVFCDEDCEQEFWDKW